MRFASKALLLSVEDGVDGGWTEAMLFGPFLR